MKLTIRRQMPRIRRSSRKYRNSLLKRKDKRSGRKRRERVRIISNRSMSLRDLKQSVSLSRKIVSQLISSLNQLN
jgi:hypothetical protein